MVSFLRLNLKGNLMYVKPWMTNEFPFWNLLRGLGIKEVATRPPAERTTSLIISLCVSMIVVS